MSFVSYAQNFEDVLLWRALGHLSDGFYIDVGANDPVEFSVTKAFYDAGWRGINIEPLPAFHATFMEQRPRDINLAVAAGAENGEVVLFDVPSVNGWASSSPEVAAMHRGEGYEVIEQRVPLSTLDAIWQKHVTGPVHFLKIDVEGFEEQVLRGLDLARHRPWVLVIEATTPNSRETNHETWEHLVTGQDYLFAYFDGLNRYYVATEHAALLSSLQVQANVFDDVITARLSQALHDIAVLRARIGELEAEPVQQATVAELPEPLKRLEERQADTDRAMAELWHNALPSITQQLAGLRRRIEDVGADADMQLRDQTRGVEHRLRDMLAVLEQQVAMGFAGAKASELERAVKAAAVETRTDSAIAVLQEQVAHNITASATREAERIAHVAALESRFASAVAKVDHDLAASLHASEQSGAARLDAVERDMAARHNAVEQALGARLDAMEQSLAARFGAVELSTERRLAPLALRMHETDRRLTSAEEVAIQANRRAGDAELANVASTTRVEQAEQRAALLEEHIRAVMSSSSWRITRPWRIVGGIVRRVVSATREGRLRSGIRRRAVHWILGPVSAQPEHGVRAWMYRVAQVQWARRIVLPVMRRNPAFNTWLRRLAGTSPVPTPPPSGDMFLAEWPGPLPAEYQEMPASSRAVLLDLARAGLPPAQTNTSLQS